MTQEYRQTRYRPPPSAADLLLVRHGESMPFRPGEPFPIKEGHGDPALHPDGVRQAERVAERLRDDPISAIYVTTLQRTHQTAAPLVAHVGLQPIVEADLREISLGDWDGGLYRQKAAARDPAFLRAMERQEWGEIPGAETNAIFLARVRSGLQRIADRHAGDRVAVFVHGGVIAAAIALASGSNPFAFMGAANGSISRLVIEGDKMNVRGFNDVSHLGDLA